MKTKIFLTVIFVCSFFQNAFSQEYPPFLNNSSWIIEKSVGCCVGPWHRMIPEGTDEVIGTYTYKKFLDPYPAYDDSDNLIHDIYIREDITAKKVYKIVNGADFLLYDFSMGLDQTIAQYGYTFKVTIVDSVNVVGIMRRRITLRSIELFQNHYSLKQEWIEGVGGPSHPFYPDRNMKNVASASGGVKYRNFCGFQNGIHVFALESSANCPEMLLSTNNEIYEDSKITFSPNPFATTLTVNSGWPLQKASVRLYNAQGRLVREINNLSGDTVTISRGNLQSGLYLVQLSEAGEIIKTAKIMVD